MIRYRLDDLGWFQFEWLCQSLLKTEFGVGVESWGGHSDLGRDAYFPGELEILTKGTKQPGPFVFQAKFVEEANAAGANPWPNLKRSILAECEVIRKRFVERKMADISHYVLLTNTELTTDERGEIRKLITGVVPHCEVTPLGAQDLCAMLDNAPNIRVAFPQLLGLRDLTDLLAVVLDKTIVERSTLQRERAAELAQVFIPTTAYNRALQTLSKHSFVVLTGPPEMGKTTIARIIGLAKLGEEWGCYECLRPEDFLQVKGKESNQVFIADDAFGTTEYVPDMAHAWAKDLDGILRSLGPKRWLIWTSRPAPLKAALHRMHLQGKASGFPKPAEVFVDASELSDQEKALILHRHAKSAGLDADAKSVVKSHAKQIVGDNHFTPERARRFVSERLAGIVKQLHIGGDVTQIIDKAVKSEIAEPTTAMRNSFEALEEQHQKFLVAMLDAGTGAVSGKSTHESYERLMAKTPSSAPEQIADDLSAHFIRLITPEAPIVTFKGSPLPEATYDWMHPSWRDLVIESLARIPSFRREFLGRCTRYGILLALSIGGGAEGTRLFPLLLDEQDWITLNSSVLRMLETGNPSDVSTLLRAILEAIRTATKESTGLMPEAKLAAISLGAAALEACRKRWSGNGETISPFTLQDYYDISEHIRPLPPSPDLGPTWDEAWSELQHVANRQIQPDNDHTYTVKQWMRVVDIIQNYEPRFLRQVGYSQQHNSRLEEYLDKVNKYIDEISPLTEDEYTADIECLSTLEKFMQEATQFDASLSEQLSELESRTSSKREKLEEKRNEEYPEPPDDYEPSGSRPTGGFDINELFSDL